MALEWIVGLGFISFVYAYLYSQSPKDNPPMKFFYLGLCLFTIVELSFIMYYSSSTVTPMTIQTQDLGNNQTLITPMQNNTSQSTFLTYFSVTQYVPIFQIFITIVLFLYNLLSGFLAKKKKAMEQGGMIPD
jgi:hypothetical protein